MAYNRNWVKTDGTRIEFAPTWLNTDAGLVINPTDEQYLAFGWKRNAVQPPNPPEGMVVAATRYEARGDSLVAVYDHTPIKRAPRVFSKLYLILALQKRGLYDQFKEMVFAAGLGDLWLAANELNEVFEGFQRYIDMAKQTLCLTDEQVEEILAEAVER